jgi:hypothetical protein
MSEQIIRYVSAREIPGSNPGRPAGNIAVIIDDLGERHFLSAANYRSQEHEMIRALGPWKEVRFLTPLEIHPADFRILNPEQRMLADEQIREELDRLAKSLGIGS